MTGHANLQALIRPGAGSGAPQDLPIWRVEVYVYMRCYQGWDSMYILVRNVRNARTVKLPLRTADYLICIRSGTTDVTLVARAAAVRSAVVLARTGTAPC